MTDHVKSMVTVDDLRALEAEDKWVEVENSEIVERERDVVLLHLIIIQNLYNLLRPFVEAGQLGRVFMDGARYILEGTPTDIECAYIPDFSFVRAGRIPADFDWTGDFPFPPDFAVEIASPGQTNTILLPKISRYLQAGTDEAWLIYPRRRELYQYRRDGEAPVIYHDNDVIDTSAMSPGLSVALGDLFVTD